MVDFLKDRFQSFSMIIILLFSLMNALFLLLVKRKFSDPSFVFTCVWIFIPAINIFIEPYSISIKTQLYICGCLFLFTLGSFFTIKIKARDSLSLQPSSNKSINFFIIFLVAFFPLYLNEINSLISGKDFGALIIRDAMTSANHHHELSPIISFGINIPIVISFYYSVVEKTLGRRLILLWLISLLYVVLSFSKGYIIQFVLPIVTALYFTQKIHAAALLRVSLFLMSIIIGLIFFRDVAVVDVDILFKMYTTAPTAALDQIVQSNSPLNFPHYRFLESIYDFFGLSILNSRETFWSDIYPPTNVFTLFGIMYNDFGLFALFAFFVLGGIASFFYKLVQKQSGVISIFIISWLYFGLMMSFFSDGLLGMIGTNLKYILTLYLLSALFRLSAVVSSLKLTSPR